MDGLAAASNAVVTSHMVPVRATVREKMDPGDDLPTDSPGHGDDLARGVSAQHEVAYAFMSARSACNAMSLPASITGNSVTVWLHWTYINDSSKIHGKTVELEQVLATP